MAKSAKSSATEQEQELHKYAALRFRTVCQRAVWFHVPNGEKRHIRTAVTLRKMGVRPGVADFILLHECRPIAIELKDDDGRLSEDQKGFRDMWTAAGGEFYIARSPHEVDGLIFSLGLC